MDDVPHINWPIRVEGTGYQTCQQDTDQEAATTVAVLCCFERGTRTEQPDFGVTDPTFGLQPVNTTELQRQVSVYEPRAQLDVRVTTEDVTGGQRLTVGVRIATVGEGDITVG
jgi:hypothetical protein